MPEGAIIPSSDDQEQDEKDERNRYEVLIISVVAALCVFSGCIYCLKKKNHSDDEDKLITKGINDRMTSVMSDVSLETPNANGESINY